MQSGIGQGKKKPTLLDLREKYGFDIVVLAYTADVDSSVVYCMLLGEPVDRSKALRVVKSLGKLVGVDYALDDVYIPLRSESGGNIVE